MSAPSTAPLIIINESNLNTGIVVKENKLIYANYYWHKIFVQNAVKYSRDFVLRTIMNTVHPLDFIPVCYDIEGEYVTFLLKNCGAAINELCRLNLTIPHPDVQKNLPPFKIAIALKHSHASELKIEIQNNISTILKRRYNAYTKTLNLEAFVKDPDLIEFCPLSQPKLMYFVLHLSREFQVENLKLNYNEIEMLKPLEALNNERSFKSLSVVDLKKNNIKTIEQLSALKSFPINEITLEDNPVCENLTEQEYVKLVREYCSKITKLDGCRVPPVGMLALRRNFLCNPLGQTFVDQFLEHYFTVYDSHSRVLLMNMYHKQAMFSITSQYVSGSIAPSNSKLYDYKKYSRNLKTLSDLSKSKDCLFFGTANIGNILKALPQTEHDPYTFTVDLTQFCEKKAIITVTGVFKEPGQSLLAADYYFGFTRTFVLTASGNMEFNITNEMFHVSNATSSQQSRAFKIVKLPRSTIINIPTATTPTEKNEMTNAFVALTNLKPDWATKCLKEGEFNLKNSLALFMDLFKADKFPSYAFDFSDLEPDPPAPEPIKAINSEGIRAKLQPVEKVIRIKPISVQTALNIANTAIPSKAKPVKLSPASQSANIAICTNWEPSVENTKKSASINESSKSKPTKGRDEDYDKDVGEDFMSADLDDFKKYTTDAILLLALKMTPDTPMDKVKDNLDAASKHILKTYTYALKYYKAIGREYYRYQLFSEARKFLTEAMAIVPKQMGEELYSMFTLFEIQHGDINISESMILVIAESFQESKTAHFIGEVVAKINTPFARQLFGMIVRGSNLSTKKKEVLKTAYVDFETKYGNVETLKDANNICKESPQKRDPKHDAKPSPASESKKSEDRITSKPTETSQKHQTQPGPAQGQGHSSQTQQQQQPRPQQRIEKPVETQTQSEPIEIIDLDIDIPPYSKPSKDHLFAEFRDKYLIVSGVLPPQTQSPELTQLQTITDKDKAVKLGETLLCQYKNDIFVIKSVCKILNSRFNMFDWVIKHLVASKIFFKQDEKALTSLVTYFQAAEDIKQKKYTEAKELLYKHMKLASYNHVILVFEELIGDITEDNRQQDQEFMNDILNDSAVGNNNLGFPKRKLMTLIYQTFCLRIKSTNADKYYKQYFDNEEPYFPEDIAELEFVKKVRARYEQARPKNIPDNIMQDFPKDCVEAQIEEMRMNFFLHIPGTARAIRNRKKNYTRSDIKKLEISGAYYEAIFGSPSIGVTVMRKINPETYNIIFAMVHCLRHQLHIPNCLDIMKTKCRKVFRDVLFLMNPFAQELLFKYHQQWLKDDFDILEWRVRTELPGDQYKKK